jgi:K319-like protein
MLTQLFQQICATKTSNVHPRRVLLSLIVVIIAGTSCTKTEVCQYCAEDNKWPVANAGADTIIVFPSDSFLLNGTASFDPDGNIVKYEWYAVPVFPFSSASKIGDPNAKQTLVTNLTPGIYRFGPPHQIGFYPWPYSGLSWNPGTTGFTTVGPLQDWQLNIAPEDNDGTKWKVQLVQKSTNTAVFLPYVKYDQITEASPSVFYTISDLVSPGPGEIPTGSIYVSAKLARPSNIDFSEKVDVVLYLKF